MRGTEHVEVALRGSWAYHLAELGDGHSYLDASLYSDRKDYHPRLSKLAGEVGRSNETYIKHYRQNYDVPALPPVWMVAEMLSFGHLRSEEPTPELQSLMRISDAVFCFQNKKTHA